jgi:hypothetical protein
MSVVVVDRVSESPAETQCRHHWLIESPHGATSLGMCKLCGAQKEFRNSHRDMLWEDEPLSELSDRSRAVVRQAYTLAAATRLQDS